MSQKQKTVLGAAIISTAVAWPFWTLLVPTFAHFVWLLPFMAADGRSVGFHFFVLRRLLLAFSITGLGIGFYSLVRRMRAGPSGKRLLQPLCAVLIMGHFLGATLFSMYPESYLYNIVVYGEFPDSRTLPGFRYGKFFLIQEGLTTREEVVELLGRGRPGTTSPDGMDRMWWYSGDWSATGWWFRVHFDDNGVVANLDSFFWWD